VPLIGDLDYFWGGIDFLKKRTRSGLHCQLPAIAAGRHKRCNLAWEEQRISTQDEEM
jgi:hypothetical protein